MEILQVRLQSHQNPLAADLRILLMHFYGKVADFLFFEESVICDFLKKSAAFPLKCIGRILKSAASRFWFDGSLRQSAT